MSRASEIINKRTQWNAYKSIIYFNNLIISRICIDHFKCINEKCESWNEGKIIEIKEVIYIQESKTLNINISNNWEK
jgi:hypothetical protein